jgi:A/G-specific adenine glycosylase
LSKQSPQQPELVLDQLHELRFKLLSWWQEHGRQTIPWKLKPDGALPAPDEQLDPYAIWVAEVMLHFATQEA